MVRGKLNVIKTNILNTSSNTKKIICGLVTLVAITVLLFGTGNKNVKMVRNGVLEIDKALTVGEAFENYKHFDDVEWEAFTSERTGKEGVQCVCTFKVKNTDTYKNAPKDRQKEIKGCEGEMIYQFVINKDDTFDYHSCHLTMDCPNEGDCFKQDFDVFENLEYVTSIYENKPLYKIMR